MSYNDITKIIDYLYISNWHTSNNILELHKNKIKAVLTIETRQKPDNIINYYRSNNIDYLFLNLKDLSNENILKYFDISYDFINKHISKGDNVLVHCWAGVSRSATLILNYLMRKYFENTKNKYCSECVLVYYLKYCQSKRPIISPNLGFINQLILYYKNSI